MFVTKKSIARRSFLRTTGAVLSLPFLDAMVPAMLHGQTVKPARRLGFMYAPNGANQAKFMPTGTGTTWEFSPTLSSLTPYRERLFIPSYLANRQSEGFGEAGGDHARAAAGWLNGSHAKSPKEKGANAPECGTSADQVAARVFEKDTRLASLELSLEAPGDTGACGLGPCEYNWTISWRNPTTPQPGESSPRVVFERLFGTGGTPEQRRQRIAQDKSILDSVLEEVASFGKKLGSGDKVRVDEYLEAIRDSERRISKAEKQDGQDLLTLPEKPLGISNNFEERSRLMVDLQVLAYQADITRISTFVIGREQGTRSYPQIGIADAHHSISHHDNDPEKLAKQAAIDTHHVKLYAYLLEKMDAIQDGDGSLLDHSAMLYGTALGDSNVHAHHDLCLVLTAGKSILKGGRHVKYPRNTPMSNLLVSMLDMVGVPVEKIGDSTGHLAEL